MTARIVCVSMISVSGSITSIIVWGGPRNYNQYRPMIFPCALSWLKTSLLLLPRITKKRYQSHRFQRNFFFRVNARDLWICFTLICLNALLTKQQRELRVYGFLCYIVIFNGLLVSLELFLFWMNILSIITQFWLLNIDALCLFINSRVFTCKGSQFPMPKRWTLSPSNKDGIVFSDNLYRGLQKIL